LVRGEDALPRLATLPEGAALRELRAQPDGLSHDEARVRLERVGLGAELPADDPALADLLGGGTSVLARIAPEQKLRVAQALQARRPCSATGR